MQTELEGEAPGAIRIVGLNPVGQESGNGEMVAGRTLPWLQDTAEVNAWGEWNVTWRDVQILDGAGTLQNVFNLTANDLHDPQAYAVLKQLLLDAR